MNYMNNIKNIPPRELVAGFTGHYVHGKDLTLGYEKLKARVRALVEHPFHIVKNLFRHRKVRYRGLRKNTAQMHTLFALANLVIARKHLLAAAA